MMYKKNSPLPDLTKKYIRAYANQHPKTTMAQRRSALRRLHHWLDLEGMTFSNLNEDFLQQFNKSLSEDGLTATTKVAIRRYVKHYFIWLHKQEILKTDPQIFFPRLAFQKEKATYNVKVPQKVENFLRLIETQMAPRTVQSYRSDLKGFYSFLKRKKLTLARLGRSHIEQYMVEIKNLDLSESTRSRRLIQLRMYLRWLHENGSFKMNPDHLIRNRDLPKIPERLPRYLPPEIDRKIQERLEASESIYHWALLLMRKTGLRIGELAALKFNCVWQNSSSQNFVKVELGKLKTERLVPVDHETLKLIHKIKRQSKLYTKTPERLVHRPSGKVPHQNNFSDAFEEVACEFKTEKPITSHQMRHTYATELLNAGMNLSVVKELLGHKSLRMTALYARVTLQTVVEEYTKATKVYQKKYVLQNLKAPLDEENIDLTVKLSEFILRFKKTKIKSKYMKDSELLLRRLKRVEKELKTILKS